MATTADEVWQLLEELIEVQKQTDHRLNEIECRLQETEKILKKLCLETKTEPLKLSNITLDSSSDFKKWRLRPIIHQLFQEREITICELWSEIAREQDNKFIQVDLLAVGSSEAIAIEVKSKLTKGDVDEHLERLDKFKRLLPRYQSLKILGAVAAMVTPSEVVSYAYRQGLFVIAQSGDNLVILNDQKFKPKAW